ncbi:MAG: cysteine--tRNA ligase, partial [Saprospiraceae bacterium]|nr:cysteine--tRNA ligase [Saprospiraceae bacterium]
GGQAGELDRSIRELIDAVSAEMNDDFNTPKALARLFELVSRINSLQGGQLSFADLIPATLEELKTTFRAFIYDVFGLQDELEAGSNGQGGLVDGLMELVIDMRQQARASKDWATSDKIRDALQELHIVLKDGKEGTSWSKS